MCVAPRSGSSYSEQVGIIPAKPVGELSTSHLPNDETQVGAVTQLGSAKSGLAAVGTGVSAFSIFALAISLVLLLVTRHLDPD